MTKTPYNKFSEYLKNKYGVKTYKIPVNIPCGCPNRDGSKGTDGCIFCGEEAAGFEILDSKLTVKKQLQTNIEYMGPKYGAKKFIAYFQNYSGTYLDFELFKTFIKEACSEKIAAVYISTRPDCVFEYHAEFLKDISQLTGIDIVIEMGLQSTNEHTLEILNRRHTAAEFFSTAKMLQSYGIEVCAHMITDIPLENQEQVMQNAKLISKSGIEQVKCHSLYILKGTKLGDMYSAGEIQMPDCSEFINRTILFLRNLDKSIVVQRLMGRAPADRTLFCNYGRSWRAVVDEIENIMMENNWTQGDMI